jgi:hypothetical protein
MLGMFTTCQCSPIRSAAMSTAATWAASARNKFRQVTRESTNPTTVALAEGLAALAEAIRDLDQELGELRQSGVT